MSIRLLLTAALAGILFYLLARVGRQRWVKLVAILSAACGIFFVWNPELSNDIAAFLGVGRGADMIFYTAIPIGAAFFLGIHVRLHEQQDMITELVRNLAIANARRPEA